MALPSRRRMQPVMLRASGRHMLKHTWDPARICFKARHVAHGTRKCSTHLSAQTGPSPAV
eukprot:4401064-Alexandrium_andersonii.AAC.1